MTRPIRSPQQPPPEPRGSTTFIACSNRTYSALLARPRRRNCGLRLFAAVDNTGDSHDRKLAVVRSTQSRTYGRHWPQLHLQAVMVNCSPPPRNVVNGVIHGTEW
jgi:hypothetical protein